jgi:integrase
VASPLGRIYMGIYKRENIFWMSYVANDGRRIRESTGVSDKAKALEFYYKKKTEIAEGKFLDKKVDKKIKFEQFADEYLEKYSKVENRAWKKSDWVYIRALKKFFSGFYLSGITKDTIARFKSEKKKEGTQNGGINRILACLKSIYNRAIEWEVYNGVNPMQGVKKLQEPSGRTRYLEREVLRNLLECCDERFKPYVIIAVHTGLRLSEQLSLKWEHLDFKNQVISVYRTKNGKKRVLPMNEGHDNCFSEYSKAKGFTLYFSVTQMGNRLFMYVVLLIELRKKQILMIFIGHDLRHTTASHLAMAGVDLYTIKDLLGHSTITMTERYAHLSKSHKENAIAVLNGLLSDSTQQQIASSKNKVHTANRN